MKRPSPVRIALLIGVALLFCALAIIATYRSYRFLAAQVGGFPDVQPTHHYAESIAYVRQRGIVEGYPDGTFRPDARINRAELVKMIIGASATDAERSRCIEALQGNHLFRDVPDAASVWYGPFLCIAKERGMITGYPDGTFKGERTLIFVEAAAIVVRSFVSTSPAQNPDDPWYAPHIAALQEHDALPATIQSLNQEPTRGEIAYMLYRMALVQNPENAPQHGAAGPQPQDMSSQNTQQIFTTQQETLNQLLTEMQNLVSQQQLRRSLSPGQSSAPSPSPSSATTTASASISSTTSVASIPSVSSVASVVSSVSSSSPLSSFLSSSSSPTSLFSFSSSSSSTSSVASVVSSVSSSSSTVDVSADLRIVAIAAPASIIHGWPTPYTVSVRNEGPGTIPTAHVWLDYPFNGPYRIEPGTDASCVSLPTVVYCTIPSIAAGTSRMISIVLGGGRPGCGGTFQTRVLVRGYNNRMPIPDPNTNNNASDTIVTSVQCPPSSLSSSNASSVVSSFPSLNDDDVDLAVTGLISPASALRGGTITVSAQISNRGTSTAFGVQVVPWTGILPSPPSPENAYPECVQAGGLYSCALGTLQPGESKPFAITLGIRPDIMMNCASPVTTFAYVQVQPGSPQAELDWNNNDQRQSLQIHCPP